MAVNNLAVVVWMAAMCEGTETVVRIAEGIARHLTSRICIKLPAIFDNSGHYYQTAGLPLALL